MTAELLKIIEEDGNVQKGRDPHLSDDDLLTIYRTMVAARTLDERGLALQRQGRIGFYLQALGQEASHVGSAFAMKDSDWFFPAYRQPGIPILRGVPYETIVDEWYGNASDTSKGRQMPVHYSFRQANFVSISSPIGTQITQATGAAMAAKARGDDTVFMTYMGDGGTSSNDFHSGLNFAGVYKSPVVFVCENNQWAISVPLSGQTASETIAQKATAYGMPGVRVDGNDVLAVYRATKEAVDRARSGGGPTLIETVTYRISSHSSSDDADRYRDKDEFEAWKKKDPIARLERYMLQRGIWKKGDRESLDESVKAEINVAIKKAEAKPKPAMESMFQDVYMNPTQQLRDQFDELRRLDGPESSDIGEFPL
ncbi:MAG: pyruvate dehydrogenase (acetyl-transferring) E1 component subunit alpha [Planctomycetota bacterium]